MFHKDKDPGSVKSLLALLRQQDTPSVPPPPPIPSRTPAPKSTSPPITTAVPASKQPGPPIPSSQDLQALLASLKPQQQQKAAEEEAESSFSHWTANTGTAAISRSLGEGSRFGSQMRRVDSGEGVRTGQGVGVVGGKGDPNMPLAQALPIISVLLQNDVFLSELRQMKREQEKLENDLWKRRGGMVDDYRRKSEEALSTAKMSGKTKLSDQEITGLKSYASSTLRTFYLTECLPFLDALRQKHAARLTEFGVPGLGAWDYEMDKEIGEEERGRIRRRRGKVMAVLEGVMND